MAHAITPLVGWECHVVVEEALLVVGDDRAVHHAVVGTSKAKRLLGGRRADRSEHARDKQQHSNVIDEILSWN